MENAKLMQLEIEKKRRLPWDVKREIRNVIFGELLAAFVIISYYLCINILFYKVETNTFEFCMQYLALTMILITVIIIEFAYRKNSLKLWINGVEFLFTGILSLYIPYIYVILSPIFRMVLMFLPSLLLIYYLIKSLILYKKKKFDYQNNLSDVKEIMQEEKESYIEEESTKTYKAKVEEEEGIKQVILDEQVLRRQKRLQDSKKQSINNGQKVNTINKKPIQRNKRKRGN